jgi:hypothetical protein
MPALVLDASVTLSALIEEDQSHEARAILGTIARAALCSAAGRQKSSLVLASCCSWVAYSTAKSYRFDGILALVRHPGTVLQDALNRSGVGAHSRAR